MKPQKFPQPLLELLTSFEDHLKENIQQEGRLRQSTLDNLEKKWKKWQKRQTLNG